MVLVTDVGIASGRLTSVSVFSKQVVESLCLLQPIWTVEAASGQF